MKRGLSSRWPVFFTNYVHSTGLEDCKEVGGQRQIIFDSSVWHAAVITLSTPPFFRPLRFGTKTKQNQLNDPLNTLS